jgi:ABC-type antimicrobial peptide transport system ATPase subunit
MSALLELNDLKKHFLVRRGPLGLGTTTVRAVDGVSFHIDRGETLALAATYSDRTHSQGASSDPGEGSQPADPQRMQ